MEKNLVAEKKTYLCRSTPSANWSLCFKRVFLNMQISGVFRTALFVEMTNFTPTHFLSHAGCQERFNVEL